MATALRNLSQVIQDPNLSMKTFNEMVANSHASINFWGERIVTVDGFRGSVPLKDLVKRIVSFSRPRLEFNLDDRKACMRTVEKLQRAYIETDQLQSTNLIRYASVWYFTFFLEAETECCNYIAFARARLNALGGNGTPSVFEGFTRAQFKSTFPNQRPPRNIGTERNPYYKVSLT